MYEYLCNERQKTKTEESTHLPYTGLVVELEHLNIKIKARLTGEKLDFFFRALTSFRGLVEFMNFQVKLHDFVVSRDVFFTDLTGSLVMTKFGHSR